MPRDLPGMYWDEQRQRYFPLASRPANFRSSAAPMPAPAKPASEPQQNMQVPPDALSGSHSMKRRPRSAPHHVLAELRSVSRTAQKDRLIHIRVMRIDSRVLYDVWTADLQGSRLVLGANKQAVVIDDIADRAAIHYLPTHSDVFALAQDDSILYTGLRNGNVLRFDTRVKRSKGDVLLDGLFTQRSSSITNLKLLRDSQLLVSNVDGSISTFDLRYPTSRTPLMTFTGNDNSYTIKAPIVTDPSEDILFAAGQDRRIRLWSLRTGGPPLVPELPDLTHQTAFQHQFEHPVRAMQVTEERDGMCLWAASGTELYKYSLGQRTGWNI
ncbi:hypothetical protein HYDPIDRAFT_30208 [Hydnomerulius pinastri MD-312]|uniref:WD40 repeat-like protein n=1 Tax=Hydnomerulius pinastri MD-312 TaxID=994086 RepID=A0A0C9W6P7_9AGAM|nr:hypothetical protein HYDPIDRAFT_30208 [Hydnomerulius pinastri MD-312]